MPMLEFENTNEAVLWQAIIVNVAQSPNGTNVKAALNFADEMVWAYRASIQKLDTIRGISEQRAGETSAKR